MPLHCTDIRDATTSKYEWLLNCLSFLPTNGAGVQCAISRHAKKNRGKTKNGGKRGKTAKITGYLHPLHIAMDNGAPAEAVVALLEADAAAAPA